MSKIKTLPKETIEKICAGEVIDSPASVIKELIENSFDAKASKIDIEIINGGKDSIAVFDNGEGFEKDDLKTALEKHTSSKIYDFEDLLNLRTLGFRGEALSSITTVSNIEIISKTQENKSGYKLKAKFGDIDQIEPISFSNGTKITVSNIFEQIPARRKFLGSELKEFRKITKILYPLILSHPEVEINITNNGKEYLHSPKQSLNDRFLELYNLNKTDFFEIQTPESKYKLKGSMQIPSKNISKTTLLCFINGRYINSPIIFSAIKQAYHRLRPDNMPPSGVLFLDIPSDEIDVNIHPKKLDLAFEYPKKVFEFVYKTLSHYLEKEFLKLKPNIESQFIQDEFVRKCPYENIEQKSLIFEDVENKTNHDYIKPTLTPLAQLFDCFIIAKSEGGLMLFDQHTIHERILFDRFMQIYEKNISNSQTLLTPEIISPKKEFLPTLKELLNFFNTLGFEIEEYGEESLIIRSTPSFLEKVNLMEYFEKIAMDFEKDNLVKDAQSSHKEILEKQIAYMACRGAIKAGRALSLKEQSDLLNQINSLKKGYTCPHGRPLSVTLSQNDLEKMFDRK